MAKTRTTKTVQELLDFLATATKSDPQVVSYGPVKQRMQVAGFTNYPTGGLTTYVTLGASRSPVSMYRGLDVGFELTLTVSTEETHLPEDLAKAVLENLRLEKEGKRRPFIEFNGVYAPGYPPHFLFTDQVTCTPKITGRKRIGERWVWFLAAIPLDDAELREYDKSVPKLIATLRKGKRIADYPRP